MLCWKPIQKTFKTEEEVKNSVTTKGKYRIQKINDKHKTYLGVFEL